MPSFQNRGEADYCIVLLYSAGIEISVFVRTVLWPLDIVEPDIFYFANGSLVVALVSASIVCPIFVQ